MTSPFVLRAFRSEDASAISELIRRAERITLKEFYSPDLIEWWCNKCTPEHIQQKAERYPLWVAVSPQDQIVGVIGLKQNHLRTFYVDPDFQGQGIGKQLFEHCKSLALEQKYSTMVVHATPFAVPIYQRFGFRKMRPLRIREDGREYEDILMYLRLR